MSRDQQPVDPPVRQQGTWRIIMQLTIISGGFIAMLFGTPLAALILLVLLKFCADMRVHSDERAMQGRPAAGATGNGG